jgi:hypothetical protein
MARPWPFGDDLLRKWSAKGIDEEDHDVLHEH